MIRFDIIVNAHVLDLGGVNVIFGVTCLETDRAEVK